MSKNEMKSLSLKAISEGGPNPLEHLLQLFQGKGKKEIKKANYHFILPHHLKCWLSFFRFVQGVKRPTRANKSCPR